MNIKSKVACALMAILLLIFSSCERLEEGQEGSATGTMGDDTMKTIAFIEDGKNDCNIVCDMKSTDDSSLAFYLQTKLEQMTGVTLPVKDQTLSSSQKEILIGYNLKRDETTSAKEIFGKRNDFVIYTANGRVAIAGSDRQNAVLACMTFLNHITWDATTATLSLTSDFSYIGSANPVGIQSLLKTQEYVDFYQGVFRTYSTYREMRYADLSGDDKNDQILIDALVERMGNSAVFYIGSSSLLNTGYIRKLDIEDYSRGAKLNGAGDVLIPKQYAEAYFEKSLSADADSYVNLTAICSAESNYSLFKTGSLVVVTPASVKSFEDPSEKVGNYTNAQYLARMERFFTDPTMVQPTNNTEQSRSVVEQLSYPEFVADYKEAVYTSLYSPCVYKTVEKGKEALYMAYDYDEYVKGVFENVSNISSVRVKKSTDSGKTWVHVADIKGFYMAQFFEIDGSLYAIGNNKSISTVLVKFKDDRKTYDMISPMPALQIRGGAPGGVMIHGGRIYKAYNAYVISADVTSDLMKPESWTASNNVFDTINNNWLKRVLGQDKASKIGGDAWTVMEPQITVMGEELYVTWRIDGVGGGKAVIMKLNRDGSFTPVGDNEGLIDFPETQSKFEIHYDSETNLYITLSSVFTCPSHVRARNSLCIAVSADLVNWTVKDYVLVDRQMLNQTYSAWFHAWQYVSFVIDGDDLLLGVREASTPKSNAYHDGELISFYRMENFRNYITTDTVISPFGR